MTADIRIARLEEWDRVRDLRLRALADAPDAFGSTLEREREYGRPEWLGWISGWVGTTNALFVAEGAGRWLGMAVGSCDEAGGAAHLYGMWVEPEARRGGIGARLVDAVVAWVAAGTGATMLVLDVSVANRDADRFYRRLGFEATGERHPLREGSAIDAVVLRRTLQGS